MSTKYMHDLCIAIFFCNLHSVHFTINELIKITFLLLKPNKKIVTKQKFIHK